MSNASEVIKGESLRELERRIDTAFDTIFKIPQPEIAREYFYITDYYPNDGYVIAEVDEKYYRIEFADTNGEITFADRAEWQEVEPKKEWVAKSKERKAALFDIDASCRHKAVKILDADDRRIGLYATVWGELDCDGERMTREAITPYHGKFTPLMTWMHGLDPDFGANPPGTWDQTASKLDDKGWWLEGNIGFDTYGEMAWERITAAAGYGGSVGSIWYLVKREKAVDGTVNITDWPPLEVAIMEGGKQCVPSAHRDMKGDISGLLQGIAAKAGLKVQGGGRPGGLPNHVRKGGTKMDPELTEATIQEQVAVQVKAALEAQKEADRKEKEAEDKRKAEVKAEANALAAEMLKAEQEKWDAEKKAFEEKIEAATKRQPLAPVFGRSGGEARPAIKVGSPFDRLSTFDMCARYQALKEFGHKPSEPFWKALASRAADMAREEDVLYVDHGKPVKASAIDPSVVIPRNLPLSEVTGKTDDRPGDVVTKAGWQQLSEIAAKSDELIYSTQSSYGDEWVPTLMNAQLWRTIRLNSRVLALFEQFDMPSQPYTYPTESTDPTFYKVAEAADETSMVLAAQTVGDSKVGTAAITFTAGKIGALTYWSEEASEDSLIALEPQIKDQYGISVAENIDDVLVNGDESTGSTNISYYGSAISSASRYLIAHGLRYEALATTATDSRSGGTLIVDDFSATQALMGTAGKYGVNPNDLIFLMDTAVWHKAKVLGEVLTMDKLGNAATIRTGMLGSIFGVPIVIPEKFGLTDSSGHIHATGTNNTLGSFLCVNKRGIKVGWRRRPRIYVERLRFSDAAYIVCTTRFDLQEMTTGLVAYTYNVTV